MDDTAILDNFGLTGIAEARAAHIAERKLIGQAVALQQQHRITTRRVQNDAELARLLPPSIAPGDSWHVLSTGDIDVLSFLRHLLCGVTHFETVLIATSRINRDDLEQISDWLDAGRIETFHLVIDQRFARLAPDEYELSKTIAASFGGSVTTCLNHSKVTLCSSPQTNTWLVVESSANVNTNRRLEQTAVCNSQTLHAFYAAAYANVRRRSAAAVR